MREYAAKYKAKHGVSPSALLRRKQAGWADPLDPKRNQKPVACYVCGEITMSTRPVGEAVHTACKPGTAVYVPAEIRQAIYERDDWTCQICFHAVDPEAHFLTDWYPTLDHIIPRSEELDHSPENLRLACRYCNVARRDRPVEDDHIIRGWSIERRGLEVA